MTPLLEFSPTMIDLQTPPANYYPVAQIAEIAEARAVAGEYAGRLLGGRLSLLREGRYDEVPIPVDPLGTVRRIIQTASVYGIDSAEYQEQEAGHLLDCQRLLMEAVRKNTYEYFPPITHTFNQLDGKYYSHGFAITDMTASALTPVAEPEEQDRRVNEHVEEATYLAVGAMALSGLLPKTETPLRIRTISECPDWAIQSHERNPDAAHGGYVPAIKKLMIRDVFFDAKTGDRYEEQVGISGDYITHEVITEALQLRGFEATAALDKTELQGTQLSVSDDILSFVALLDQVATKQEGTEIYMGTVASPENNGNYALIPLAAEARKTVIEDKAAELAELILNLEAVKTERWLALGLVESAVKEILLGLTRTGAVPAKEVFDVPTQRGYERVAAKRALGLDQEADELLALVERAAPAPSYCGAGSCGLVSLSATSDEAKKMEAMGMDSKGAIKDNNRRCKHCSKKEIVYSLISGKKGCLGCGATAKL